jgi:hypothetical protein
MANHDKKVAACSGGFDTTAREGNSVALRCLNDTIAAFTERLPRKVLAAEVGASEQTFSKMTGGKQAFGLKEFELLPRSIQVDFMERYGREVLGLQVRDLAPAEINAELLALVDQMVATRRLSQLVGKAQPAKAELHEEKKRAASW